MAGTDGFVVGSPVFDRFVNWMELAAQQILSSSYADVLACEL
jgi:hypothetical protein